MSADSKASNSKFLKGTLILTASSIVVKVIGSLNWIILSRVLGGEGIGLYQMGFRLLFRLSHLWFSTENSKPTK